MGILNREMWHDWALEPTKEVKKLKTYENGKNGKIRCVWCCCWWWWWWRCVCQRCARARACLAVCVQCMNGPWWFEWRRSYGESEAMGANNHPRHTKENGCNECVMVIVFDRQRKAVFRFDFQSYRGGGIWTRSAWIGFFIFFFCAQLASFLLAWILLVVMGRRLIVRRLQDVYLLKFQIVS